MKINKYKILLLLPLMKTVLAMPIAESQAANSKMPSNINNNMQHNSGKALNNATSSNTNFQSKNNSPIISPKVNTTNYTAQTEKTPVTDKAKTVNDPNKVILNFENADIQTVIKAISVLSGKNFVIDPRVKGTVNIVSDKPVSKADSYKVLESALRMQGFASVEADGVIKVLPEADARTYGMKMDDSLGGTVNPKRQLGDQVITKIFVIQHGSATALVNALRPLVAPNNSIGVYPNSNAIIVTDYSSNIKRIAKIISQLTATDEGVATKPVIVQLHNAVAADVAEILNSYMSGGGTSGGAGAAGGMSHGGRSGGSANSDTPSATITVNANGNALIIYSPIQSTTTELVNLAQQIDKDTSAVNNNLHVVYLRNGDASHIAEILRDVMKNQEDPDIKASSTNAKFATEPTSTFSAGGASGSSGSPTGGGAAPSAPPASAKPVSSNKGPGNSTTKPDQPDVIIQADPTTNALIIQAPQAIYRNMRMIIDMLDVRRAQVMIEAMIADITQDQVGAFGIQWLTGAGNNNMGALALGNYGGSGPGGTSTSLSSLATTGITAAQGLNGGANAATAGAMGAAAGGGAPTSLAIPNEMLIGLVTGTVSVGGQTIPGLSTLANMIENNSAGNILSRPTIITMDNEEARIMVGQNIGIPNGSIQSAAGIGAAGATTVTRQDLGIILQIKPLITQSGAIQLEVYQEDSSVDPSVPVTAANIANGPTFLERKLRTTLLVDDGQIIALGGMTEDSITLQQNGIPGLSDIPYIGWLFSWQYRKHSKKNLVLFLRPVIIKNADGAKALTNERYNYIMDVQNQISAKGNAMLPGINAVNMNNQLPYDDNIPARGNPALNLNKNLPIVDTTSQGKNFNPQQVPQATDVSAVRLTPLKDQGQ